MTELARIAAANDWAEYYSAYQSLYQQLIVDRWAFGQAAAAHHIHHLAVPDISGQVPGGISWAAYSQPSRETLLAALPLFRQLVDREPVRRSANRYLFFCTRGAVPTPAAVREALGPVGVGVRYSVLSLEAETERPVWQGALAGALALVSDRSTLNFDKEMTRQTAPEPLILVGAERLQGMVASGGGDLFDRVLIGSSLVLLAARGQVSHEVLSDRLQGLAWLSGHVARERAIASKWSTLEIAYCAQVRDAAGLSFDTYTIQPGEILSRIIRTRYSVPFERMWPVIRAANPAITDPNHIRAGQVIRLPTV